MKKDPVTIGRDALLSEAVQLLQEQSIRYLPVMDGDMLVGFVTQSGLRSAALRNSDKEGHVLDIMIRNPVSINVNASIEMAARLMHEYKIGGLPVLDKKKLVGIITASDVLSAFIEVMGLLKPSSRLDVLVAKPVGVEDVIRILKQQDCEIISLTTENHSSRRKVYCFRLERCNLDEAVQALGEAGHKVVSVVD